MTTTPEPRYEYRVWGAGLDDIATRIRSLSDTRHAAESTDTYLVPHSFAGANPKLRAGRVDVKVLLEVRNGFERWTPYLTGTFPLDAAWIRDRFYPVIGLDPPAVPDGRYGEEEFLERIISGTDGVSIVSVDKLRRFYDVDGCIAEIADLAVAGLPVRTIAIESADLEALDHARRLTGIDRHPNASYAAAIPLLLGWNPAEPSIPAGGDRG